MGDPGREFDKNTTMIKLKDPVFDMDSFQKMEVQHKCLAIRVDKALTDSMKNNKNLAPYILKTRGVRNILQDSKNEAKRLILLAVQSKSDIPKTLRKEMKLELVEHAYTTGYENLSYTEVLRALIPSNIEVPAAFERIGHIAHLNLCANLLPYKKLIGHVILDKHQGIRTVVNKKSSLTSEFRTPDLELLAGEDSLVAETVENGIRFHIDYGKVYWNSRLSKERERLSARIPATALVCDVMTGVGAFAMYLAKKGCYVLANDLNKEAMKWIAVNREANKVEDCVCRLNMDGRDFIQYCLEEVNVLQDDTKNEVVVKGGPLGAPHVFEEGADVAKPQAASSSLDRTSGAGSDINGASVNSIPDGLQSCTGGAKADTICLNGEDGARATYVIPLEALHTVKTQERTELKRELPVTDTSIHPIKRARVIRFADDDTLNPQYVLACTEVHFVLNLPQIALEFLDTLRSLLTEHEPRKRKTCHVHCYCFARPVEAEKDIKKRVINALGIEPAGITFRQVRNVAPTKHMYCVEFSF